MLWILTSVLYGNNSMLPRLPRPTGVRVRAHQEGIDVAGRSPLQLSPIANGRASRHDDWGEMRVA